MTGSLHRVTICPEMRAVNIKEAKAHLNALIEAAQNGVEVVLMRGSTPVAVLRPITEADLEVAPMLTDRQAAKLFKRAREEPHVSFPTVEEAVEYLRRLPPARAKRKVG